MKHLRCFTLILLATACAHAEDWTTTKKACQDARFFHGFQFHNAEECAVDFFTLDPVGPAVSSVTTGSGFGGGTSLRQTAHSEQYLHRQKHIHLQFVVPLWRPVPIRLPRSTPDSHRKETGRSRWPD